jgi:hypothetical protein
MTALVVLQFAKAHAVEGRPVAQVPDLEGAADAVERAELSQHR